MTPESFAFSPAIRALLQREDGLHILVTGGRGWIGRACLELLDEALGEQVSARVGVYGSSHGAVALSSGRTLPVLPLSDIASSPPVPTLVAHFAYLTKDKAAALPLANFVEGNRAISARIEDALRRLRPAGFLMPSSGAAIQPAAGSQADSYGMMKHDDEVRFLDLCASLDIPFTCPRLFNLSGPFINKLDSYALASIIRDMQTGRPIELRANRKVIRSYVHVRDLLDICFGDLLLSPHLQPPLFETAGERTVEIGDLAHLAARLLGDARRPVLRPAFDDLLPPDRYVGDPTLWRARLAHRAFTPATLETQILDTARYLVHNA